MIIIVGLKILIVWSDHKVLLVNYTYVIRCLNHFYSEEKLKIHGKNCKNKKAVAISMPKKGEVTQFKNYVMSPPFGIHADFECLLPKMSTTSN